jgi:hypothetical protein
MTALRFLQGVICERSEEIALRYERKRRSRACSWSLSHWTRSRTYCRSVERDNLARFKLCGGLENSAAMQEGRSRESGLGVLVMQHMRRAGLKEVVGS